MTPHPGEAAALLGVETMDIQENRLEAVESLRRKFPGGYILLKGYRTLIMAPDGNWTAIGSGNAALAKAGSGDVLSGMLGAHLANGKELAEAHQAVLRHAMAADHWVLHHPDHAMLAEDIIDDLTRKL